MRRNEMTNFNRSVYACYQNGSLDLPNRLLIKLASAKATAYGSRSLWSGLWQPPVCRGRRIAKHDDRDYRCDQRSQEERRREPERRVAVRQDVEGEWVLELDQTQERVVRGHRIFMQPPRARHARDEHGERGTC